MNEILNVIQKDLAFYVFSVLVIAGALGVILESNIVRAGFSLVICFASIAGVYFALRAPFVGAGQILIYGVGITLVIVFALMLTNLKQSFPKIEGEKWKNIFSAIISIGIFLVFSYVLTGNKWVTGVSTICPRNTEIIGFRLLNLYVLPFELISVLLLVALIGSVVIAKKDSRKDIENLWKE